MDDEELTRLFRTLDEPAEPDPAFANALFTQLQAGAAGGSRARTSVAVVAGVIVVAALLVVALAIGSGLLRLPFGAADLSPSLSPGALASAASSAAVSSPPSASGQPSTAPSGGQLSSGNLVRTTVDALTVRADPGISGERQGTLALGAISYLVSGAPPADGYDWFLVSGLGLPPASGCITPIQTDPYDCPIWFGWVAGAATDGTPWLERADAQCADPPPGDLQTLTLGHPSLELLHCYAGQQLVFHAWLPDPPGEPAPCEATTGPLWLLCPQVILGWEPSYPEAIAVALNPDAGVALPEQAQWIEVTAHLGDPEAANCAEPADATAEELRIILGCRSQLVMTRAEPAPGP